jgi:DNA-binding Xre family transcriptional regulator
MSPTEYLEQAIIKKFKNKKRFSEVSEIPYMTVSNILSRGVDNAGINTVMKICDALEIDINELFNLSRQNGVKIEIDNDEHNLISGYRSLNSDGKTRLTTYLNDLLASGNYDDETCATAAREKSQA